MSYRFIFIEEYDSDYANFPLTRFRISNFDIFLEGSPVTTESATQNIVALSIPEAEIIASVCG